MNVFVVRKDGSGLVRVNPPGTTSWLDAQSWSPDGKQVALVASRDGHSGNAVFVVNADGTGARRITPWNVTLRADWSPDGQWIALDMSDAEPVPRDLFLVHPDGTGLRKITSNEDNKMSFAPAWSADSKTLLVMRREYSADGTDLWTVNVDGTGMFQVTHPPAEYSGYRLAPVEGLKRRGRDEPGTLLESRIRIPRWSRWIPTRETFAPSSRATRSAPCRKRPGRPTGRSLCSRAADPFTSSTLKRDRLDAWRR